MSTKTPKQCPGLNISEAGVLWVDSLGRVHDLEREELLSTGDVALRTKRSVEWVLRQIRAGDLYPVVYWNSRNVEVYGCALLDFYARALAKGAAA